MKLTEYKQQFSRNLSNAFGWTTSRKYVIFESDDWGSIRMPSLNIYNDLQQVGLNLSQGDALRFNTNDTLASDEDLNELFAVLSSFRDSNGKPCVFTALSLVANPDFKKIKDNNFKEYFFEPFTSTLERYYGHSRSIDTWKQGINNGVFAPEFHGREHLNVMAWMKALQSGDPHTQAAFEKGVWSFRNLPIDGVQVSYQAAFDLISGGEIDYQKEVIKSGLDLFEKIFGYKATFFVPPNGPINNSLHRVAASKGIKFISTSKIQREAIGNGKVKKRYHYLGQKTDFNQRYITRNCFFEPTQPGKDWVNSCLNDVAIAFRWNKPAVISTHRVNYIGKLNKQNRISGLQQLTKLVTGIQKRWPQVEFITTPQLGEIISSN